MFLLINRYMCFILPLIILIIFMKVVSLNINGINNIDKQLELVSYIKYKKIDILFLQEHNLRERNLICNELLELCDIFINLSVNQKGGTATLISKKFNYGLQSNEFSADGRIVSTIIKHYNTELHLVNVYAPASASHSERDSFFQNDLL